MIRNRILLKSIAVFLLLETVFNTVAPTISWALTAGPTAPEATSFEPVDTTDMVNLATGDLAYNLPLLEVPGPSGGYPLSLSYHAGIQPNEDASWTGLGFALNAGAIVRNVNGFADDHSNVQNSTRVFWEGGETKTYTVGITVGIAGTPASVTAGLSYSQDTYMGNGVGASLKGGAGPLSVEVGVDGYGNPYGSTGISASVGLTANSALFVGGSVGINTNFKSVSTFKSVTYGTSIGPLDASITTGSSGQTSIGIGDASFVSSTKSGMVSESSSGITVPLPIFYGVSLTLGYNYHRYWIDQMEKVNINGALNYPVPSDPNAIFSSQYFDANAFDTYSLLDQTLNLHLGDNANSDKVLGGSFPNFDNYFVNAQGLFGAMRPHYFQKHLNKRNNYSDTDDGRQYSTIQYDLARNQTKENRRAEFRFINDFSNRFEYDPDRIHHIDAPYPDPSMQYHFEDGSTIRMGENATSDYTSNLVQGSKSIQWFTNEEIVNKVPSVTKAGFIETVSTGFNRGTTDNVAKPKQIGGFTIVNESGVKYHFALPAYSYDDYMYSGNRSNGLYYNEFYKREPYAYTWYLTAITGPDYVDRGIDGAADGKLNEYDWGYWVEFEYGKWTDIYAWRNPSEGMANDLDKHFQNFSEGRKELYYLDAIRTKSHTALFFKDIRDDGKSSLYFKRNISHDYGFDKNRKEEIVDQTRQGGFTPKAASCSCNMDLVTGSGPRAGGASYMDVGTLDYVSSPTSTLKLSSIVLLDNESLKGVLLSKSGGEEYAQKFTYNWNVTRDDVFPAGKDNCDFSSLIANHHLYENVLDIHDLDKVKDKLNNVTLRSLKFNTDYSLSPETANSFDSKLVASSPSLDDSAYPRNGKLTLKEVEFLGKSGADLLPSVKFNYDYDNPVSGSGVLAVNNGVYTFAQSNSALSAGDIITFNQNGKACYALVTAVTDNAHTLKVLGKNSPMSGTISYQKTKNPPYNKEAYDVWGLYKPDYQNTNNIYFDRAVTDLSAANVDAWSLQSVDLSTGGRLEFDYQPDQYRKAAINANYDFQIYSIKEDAEPNMFHVYLTPPDTPRKRFAIGDEMYLSFLYMRTTDKEERTCGNLVRQDMDLIFKGNATIRERIVDPQSMYIHFKVESPDLEKKFRAHSYKDANYCEHPVTYSFTYGYSIPLNKTGGGIRVATVRFVDGLKTRETNYDYSINGAPSGVTSYEPNIWDRGNDATYKFEKDNKLGEGHNLLSISREVPAPGIIYEYVTVREKVIDSDEEYILPNYSRYNFQVFDAGMVGVQYMSDETSNFSQQTYDGYIDYSQKQTRNVVLKNFAGSVGMLKGVRLYNNQDELVSETQNNYLQDGITGDLIKDNNDASLNDAFEANIKYYEPRISGQFNNQGVIEETYTDARFVSRSGQDFSLQGVITKREQYPSIQTGQTVINYKTGITTKTVNTAYDYYSGQVTESLSYDGYGNTYQTKIIPAYRQYAAMGQTSHGGANMLTQQAASYAYKIDPSQNNKKIGLVSASVQTWSDKIAALQPGKQISEPFSQSGIWRKASNYTFIGVDGVALRTDGLYPADNVTAFNAWNPGDAVTAGWQNNNGITLYGINSHALEAVDVNGNYAATRMSFDQSRVIATVTNARYGEFGYSGAEERALNDAFGSDVYHNSTSYTPVAHTGSKALVAAANTRGFTFYMKPKQRTYRVNVWSSQPSANIKYKLGTNAEVNAAARNKGKSGNWYLLEADIAVTDAADKLEIWCEAGSTATNFDDFRVKPVDAAMTSYVYNQWGELSHILDNNNLYTEYRYDGMGRLNSTYKESFQVTYGDQGIVKTGEVSYNYGTNTPFMLTVGASSTGTRGYIYPSGNVSIAQGKDLRFELRDKCQYNTLGSVWIDGKKIDLDRSSITLADGTTVYIQGAGKVITFKNIQTAHTLRADFTSNSVAGVVVCNGYTDGNGNTCYDGGYKYAYYDLCGNQGSWMNASRLSEIPADLRSLAVGNCCQYNNGTVSGCSCKPGSTGQE